MHKNIDCFTLDQMEFNPVTRMDATTLRSRMKTVKSLLDAGRFDEAKVEKGRKLLNLLIFADETN